MGLDWGLQCILFKHLASCLTWWVGCLTIWTFDTCLLCSWLSCTSHSLDQVWYLMRNSLWPWHYLHCKALWFPSNTWFQESSHTKLPCIPSEPIQWLLFLPNIKSWSIWARYYLEFYLPNKKRRKELNHNLKFLGLIYICCS